MTDQAVTKEKTNGVNGHTPTLTKEEEAALAADESRRKKILGYLFVFFASGFIVFYFFMPNFTQKEKDALLRIPKSGDEFMSVFTVLKKYSENNAVHIHVLLVYIYIFLQSFGIPGTYPLSIIMGALLGPYKGFITCQMCSFTGASICYWLSLLFGRSLVRSKLPGMLKTLENKVQNNKDNLFWYTLFLRVTPICPSWFVNMACPIVGVPFKTFFAATAIGFIPVNIVLVSTGMTLSEISSVGFNPKLLIFNICLGCLALIPTFFKNKIKDKIE